MDYLDNLLLNTDSYKPSHWLQYPPNTEYVFSYIESRGGDYNETVFFGLQGFIKDYLLKPITQQDINYANSFYSDHVGPNIFNKEGWEYILKRYGGYLPLKIRAVPEGLVVPTLNVLVNIENTDPKCYWLTSYVETAILRAVWYGTTVATQSWHIKQDIKKMMEKTCDNLDGLPFKLHDFGARGVSSHESAAIGGAAHLINFLGSDTMAGAIYANTRYQGFGKMFAYSVPAAEHSSITS